MAQSLRQRNLFAAEDYRVVYDSFRQANFQAYDYDTIRGALTDYIRQKYPENFNDWIQSSEFVALIETLAFLAHSLAFRIDQAGRENFLSTAERRQSVLRIADFIGYTPKRHFPARGELKVISVKTTQDVFSINGSNLKNQDVNFENNFQNFLLIMNETFSVNNKFGRPNDTVRIGNVKNDIYTMNITRDREVAFDFNARVNGNRSPFQVHGLEINEEKRVLEESEPNPFGKFNLVYKNDGQGLGSNHTGFFVGFKQGTLQFTDINADRAVNNLLLDLNSQNVNNDDIWVQEINTQGEPQETWTRVDTGFGANMIFNNISQNVRKLYSVKTVDNDNVNIRFGDGVFSEIPRGTIRVWYRTGLNQTYTLSTDDVGTVSFTFNYESTQGNIYAVTFTCELQEPVTNAASQESVTSIKNNAGRFFAAQDRMVTASDYSVYPLTVSENIRKIKAVNRTYTGHSRYIKSRDPTATYQNVDMIASDGYIYKQPITYQTKLLLPADLTATQIYNRYLDDLIANPELINLFYEKYTEIEVPFLNDVGSFEWQQVTTGFRGSTGYFTRSGFVERAGNTTSSALNDVREGAIVEFVESPYVPGSLGVPGQQLTIVNPGRGYRRPPVIEIVGNGTGAIATASVRAGRIIGVTLTNPGQGYTNPVRVNVISDEGVGGQVSVTAITPKRTWARVVDIVSDGLGMLDTSGRPTGLTSRGQGAVVLNKNIPNTARVSRIFPAYRTTFSLDVQNEIIENLENLNSFGLRYDARTNRWRIVTPGNIASELENNPDFFSLDFAGNNSNGNLDNSWFIRVTYTADSWSFVSRRSRIVFGSDEQIRFYNQNQRRLFNVDTNKPDRDRIVALKTNTRPNGSFEPLAVDMPFFAHSYYTESDGYTDDRKIIITVSDIDNDNYPDNPIAFKTLVGEDKIQIGSVQEDGELYTVRVDQDGREVSGRDDLSFNWKRISKSNYRIDPSLSNIIDIYVLDQNYDTQFREWLADDRVETNRPEPPTETTLEKQFVKLDMKKTISDSIVYRAGEYRVLFGEMAETELKGRFKIVKVPGTTLTNNEIKSRTLVAIREFFDIENWDFGEVFYFTELSAYIHQELPGIISSIVLEPIAIDSEFGNLFQITPESNQVFIPDVTLRDIEIVETLNRLGRNNG